MVAPILPVVRTAIAGVVVPAGNGDEVAFAAAAVAGHTHSAVADSSYAAAVAEAASADSVVDAIAAESSAWAWGQDVGHPVAVAEAVVLPVVVVQGDLLQAGHWALVIQAVALVVLLPFRNVVAAAAVVALVDLVVPGRTCVLQLLVSRPYSAVLCSVRTGRGGPSSCSGRDSHGTGAASDVPGTHSGHPWAACHRLLGPCAVEGDRVAHRAFLAGDAEAPRHVVAYRIHRHYGQASSRDAGAVH